MFQIAVRKASIYRSSRAVKKSRSLVLLSVVSCCYFCWLWVFRRSVIVQRDQHQSLVQLKFTIFSCPKGPQHPQTAANEESAFRNWIFQLSPEAAQVVLVGIPGSEELERQVLRLDAEAERRRRSTRVIFRKLKESDIVVSSDGDTAPSVRAVFLAGESAVSRHDRNHLLVFVNSDILFQTDMLAKSTKLVRSFKSLASEVVISGARTDCIGKRRTSGVSKHFELEFSEIFSHYESCTSHRPTGKDYFVYTRTFWQRHGVIPDFMLGRTAWDNYLMAIANIKGIFIDASAIVTALHLEHTYGHSVSQTKEMLWKSSSANLNRNRAKEACKRFLKGRMCFDYNLNQAKYRACPSYGGVYVGKAIRWKDDENWQNMAKEYSTWPRNCTFSRDVYKCHDACGS